MLSLFIIVISGCHSKTKEEFFNEGIKLMQRNNLNGAIVFFKNALDKDPNYFEARFELAKAYFATEKYDQAEKELLKVSRQNPSYVKLELGKLYIAINKPDEAINEAERYLQFKPDDPEAFEIIGVGYAAKGKLDEAERHIKKALRIDPNKNSAKLTLARIYMGQGNKQGARSLLEEVINNDKKSRPAYYLLANLEMSSGNLDKAVKVYKTIAEIEPRDTYATFRAAMLYFSSGKLAEAETIAEDLLKRFPERPEGHMLKGFIHYYRKEFDKAITELQTSLKAEPRKRITGDFVQLQPWLHTYYFLGLSYYHKGALEQALSQFNKALDLNPSFVQARLLVSIILLKQKRIDDAITEAKRVLEHDEGNAIAHNILGSAYMAKAMYDEAVKELNKAIDLDPKLVDTHLKKGILSISQGKANEGESELKTAVKVDPQLLNTRLILASYFINQKKYNKAIQTMQEAIAGKKSDALLYNNIATLFLAEKKEKDALRYFQKAKEVAPDYFTPYFNLAGYYLTKKDFVKVMDEYKAVLKRDPKNVRAMLSLASTLELQGNDNEAFRYYNEAKDTKATAGFIALANYYARKKQSLKAINALDEAIRNNPRDIDAMEMKGKVYLSEKKYKEAVTVFEGLEALNPQRALPLIINAFIANHEYARALRKIENTMKADPKRIDLMAEISKIYMLMGDMSKARDNANKIIETIPHSAFGYMALASVYERQNDSDNAIAALKKGLAVDGKNPDAAMLLGNIYINKKEYGIAMKVYGDILKREPRYVPAIFAQGTVYDLMGKRKEAAKKYNEILGISENNVPALNNLALLYADGFGSKEESLRLAMKAYTLSPGNGGVMDTLGYALLKNGRKDDATKLLEKAVTFLPGNPSVHYHLALAYKESNYPKEAKKHLEEALKKGDFPESAAARKLLGELTVK